MVQEEGVQGKTQTKYSAPLDTDKWASPQENLSSGGGGGGGGGGGAEETALNLTDGNPEDRFSRNEAQIIGLGF